MTEGGTLYRGRVTHTRLRPKQHSFRYRVFYGLFDIDRLDELDRDTRLFSHNRWNLFSLQDRDHGAGDGSSLRSWANAALRRAGVDPSGTTIRLLAFPRVLGYVFNPLSVWYCFDADDRLIALIHEVRNTFGDKHSYVVPVDPDDLAHSFDKELHVSPFMDMNSRYHFTVRPPRRRLTLGIEQTDDGGPLFRAGLSGTAEPFEDRTLLRLFVTHPLVTLKAIVAIHFEAVRLWIKGIKFHRRPEPPISSLSVVTTEEIRS